MSTIHRYAITFETVEPLSPEDLEGLRDALYENGPDIAGTQEIAQVDTLHLTLPPDGDISRVLGLAAQFLDEWKQDASQGRDAASVQDQQDASAALDRAKVVLLRAMLTREALGKALDVLTEYEARLYETARNIRNGLSFPRMLQHISLLEGKARSVRAVADAASAALDVLTPL